MKSAIRPNVRVYAYDTGLYIMALDGMVDGMANKID